MKICGIIAEYNPLHNGHLYHLQEAKRISEADYTVIVMSGNFVQRGTPAVMDKFVRARAALTCGADLVIELPSLYAACSAEYFAAGAISVLEHLGAVTHLCFGSECGEITWFKKVAQILAKEPAPYRETLQKYLKQGASYPIARTAALKMIMNEPDESMDRLNSPNNILGIEYLKSMIRQNSAIIPFTIKRQGADYHDTQLNGSLSSATALRRAMQHGNDLTQLKEQIPEAAFPILMDYLQQEPALYANDFSALLHYKLLSECNRGFSAYADVSQELSDRICNHIYQFTDFDSFCSLLKTKELTYTRISRCLLHILLNIKKEQVEFAMKELSVTPYARVLGFRKDAAPLLSTIGKQTQIPLITKLADAHRILADAPFSMLQNEITINNIYNSVRAKKSAAPMVNEYTTPIVIV